MDPLTSILLSITSSIVLKAGCTILDWMQDKKNVLMKAAKRTDRELGISLVGLSLEAWTWSDDFKKALASLYEGNRAIPDTFLIESYKQCLPATGNADQIAPLATEIIKKFFTYIWEELLKSDKGQIVHAAREEALHAVTQTRIDSLQQQVNDISVSLATTGARAAEEDKHSERLNAQLDVVKELLNHDKYDAALQELTSIGQDAARSGASSRVRFRISTGLASCAIERGDVAEAIAEYKKAYCYEPMEIVAVSNRAYAAFLEHHYDEAEAFANEALELSGNSIEAVPIRLAILEARGKDEEIEGFIKERKELLDNPRIRLILGQIRMKRGDFALAREHFEKAIELCTNDWRPYYFHGVSLLSPVQVKLHGKALLPPPMTDDDRAIIKAGILSLDHALVYLEASDLKRETSDAYASRAAAKALLGELSDADSDCRRAVAAYPKGYLANRNSGIMALEKGDFDSAVFFFSSIDNPEEHHEVTIPHALALLKANKNNQAALLLEPPYLQSEDQDEIVQIGLLLIQSYSREGKPEMLREMLTGLEGRAISESHKDILRVEIYGKLGTPDCLNEALERLLKESDLPRFIGLHAADILYDNRDYTHAADLYGKYLSETDGLPHLQRYVISLYNSRRPKESLETAQRIRGQGSAIPVVSEIEAFVLEYYGYIDKAALLYEQLSQAEPANPTHKLHHLECLMRLGQEKEAQAILLSMLDSQELMTPTQLIHVSKLQLILKVGEPLATLYEGLKRGYDDPEIQLSYIGLLHSASRGLSVELLPQIVQVDCVAILKEQQLTSVYAIVEDSGVAGPIHAIRPDSKLARALIGKKVGDLVQIQSREQGAIQDRWVTIAAVFSKYVYAFQQIGATFETRFMGAKGFQRVDISENDLSEFKLMIKKKHLYVAAVLRMYEAGRLTLGTCASITGDSLIDAWGAMVSLENGSLFVTQGSTLEAELQETAAVKNSNAILDLSAVLTIVSTGLGDYLFRHFDILYIPQSVVDEISQELANYRLVGRDVGMMVGMRNGEYVRQELTDDDHKRQEEFYERLLAFCRSEGCRIVTPQKAIGLDTEQYDQMCRLVGRASIDAILLADEMKLPLYSDDLFLRQFAQTHQAVSAFVSTPYVLAVLFEKSLITEIDYYKAIRKLVLSNYAYVRIPSGFLTWLLKENQMRITPAVEKIFRRTFGPVCDPGAAVSVASSVIKDVWLATSLSHFRSFILDFICQLFLGRPDGRALLASMEKSLKERFYLYPQPLREIIPRIRFWRGIIS